MISKIQLLKFMTTGLIFDRLYMKNIKEVATYSKGNVLDIGCGTKPYKSYFSHSKYIGMDIPQSEIKNSKLDVVANGFNLPFKDKSFDTVICLEVIEHVTEPQRILREIRRVLKSGGFLILSTPQAIFIHGSPRDYYRFTEYGLEFLIKSSGFKKIKCLKTTGSFGTVGFLLINAVFNITGNRKSILNYIFKSIFLVFCFVIQLMFLSLDYISRYKGSTVDNMIIAKR